MCSIPGSGWSPGGEHGKPLQYSCLENPMDRGACWAIVHRVTERQTWLKWLGTHTYTHYIFIHWSVGVPGLLLYLDCILAIVNHAAMNTEVHVSFQLVFSFSLYIYATVELLGHMVVLLVFWGTSILFSTVAVPIYVPTNSGIISVQSLSHCVWLFATSWTAARRTSLSITSSRSSPKPMSIESVMSSDHLIICCLLLFRLQSFPAS